MEKHSNNHDQRYAPLRLDTLSKEDQALIAQAIIDSQQSVILSDGTEVALSEPAPVESLTEPSLLPEEQPEPTADPAMTTDDVASEDQPEDQSPEVEPVQPQDPQTEPASDNPQEPRPVDQVEYRTPREIGDTIVNGMDELLSDNKQSQFRDLMGHLKMKAGLNVYRLTYSAAANLFLCLVSGEGILQQAVVLFPHPSRPNLTGLLATRVEATDGKLAYESVARMLRGSELNDYSPLSIVSQ